MRALACLLALCLSPLAASPWPSPPRAAAVADRVPAPAAVPRLRCGQPESLRLRRFEDGSAWLRCASRTIARIGVPG